VQYLVENARENAEVALEAFRAWNYVLAARKAHRAYILLSRAAARLGISTPSDMALRIAPSLKAPHEGDPIRFPDN
jgi:hypothetical protein